MVIGLQHLILKENNNQTNLTLSVGLNSISLSVYDLPSGKLIKFDKVAFSNPLSIEGTLDELKDLLNKNDLDFKKIENIKLIQQNNLSVLVPSELYSEKQKSTYLKYNTQIRNDDFIAVDNLNNLKIKNIYIPYININNYLVDLFKNIEYFHYDSELLNKLYEIRRNEEFFVHVDNRQIKIVVFKNDTLNFFNSYEIDNSTDIIYYILLVLKEKKLNIDKTEINYITDYEYDDLSKISDNFFGNHKVLNRNYEADFLHY
ncbi:MAG: hypothetical protein CMD13_04580 [Flavobacteriales bacterium]|nr:hypothetical protein [Flavobacteriales bacterium]|tara:strand:+ start:700 stop:1476 length:777 start_codon:yes stop_codon:yes gene_type:complete